MPRFFPRRLLLLVGALCLFTLSSPQILAADKDEKKKKEKEYDEVKFDTVDQVEIHGRFYASKKGKKAPTVLVLTKLGGDIRQDGWDRLAEGLKQADYSVLLFDFRGCGDSKSLASPDFWRVANNRESIKGGSGNPVKTSIDFKDFNKSYYPTLINDIAAARLYLDRKNDGGECNSSDLIVLGAEDGASLGLMWIYSEWYRHRLNSVGGQDSNPEGKDIACAIWLSYKRSIGSYSPNPDEWFRHVGREKKIPMAFVCGDGDRNGEELAKYWVDYMKKKDSKGDTGHKLTGSKTIEKADKVAGSELLQKNLKTQDWIIEYTGKVMEAHSTNEWSLRETEKNAYVWTLPSAGGRIVAKVKESKTLNLMPLQALLR